MEEVKVEEDSEEELSDHLDKAVDESLEHLAEEEMGDSEDEL